MNKLFAAFKLDPRLLADLRSQKRLIVIGLLCVFCMSLLEGATLPLLQYSVNSIQEAAPRSLSLQEEERVRREQLRKRAERLSERLGVGSEPILEAMIASERANRANEAPMLVEGLSKDLGLDPARVRAALDAEGGSPVGNILALRRLGLYCILIVAIFAVKYWFTRGQAYYLNRAAARLATDLRLRLFAKLQRLPVSYFSGKRSGAIYSVLTNDVNVYQNAVTVVKDSIDGPLKALISLAFIFYTQWQLALVTLLFLPAMALVIQRNGRKMRAAQSAVQEDLAEVAAMSNEALLGTRVIRAFAAEGQVQASYGRLVERSFLSQRAAIKRLASLRPLVELIGAAGLAAVLYLCGWLSYAGVLRLGEIAALLYALDRINQGFKSIGAVSSNYNMAQAAAKRIYSEVLDVPEPHGGDTGRVLEHPQGRIEFRNVTFAYPDGTEALRDVSFTIEPGTSLALVGPSGAGKSTIADLILRFYEPTAGQILFDGVDLRELKASWLRGLVGVVPQQTFLFAGTISENIRMGKADADDAEVAEAARLSHVEEFVRQLDDRYETQLGESGSRLSGGQRQRVAIARALVRKPKVLILDEATSALDPASEKVVTEALDEVMHSRTTLVIAHRLTTAARADRILVLRRGEVVEVGSHRELMDRNGVYAGLFQAFSGGVLD